jgi:hypothetical protein
VLDATHEASSFFSESGYPTFLNRKDAGDLEIIHSRRSRLVSLSICYYSPPAISGLELDETHHYPITGSHQLIQSRSN